MVSRSCEVSGPQVARTGRTGYPRHHTALSVSGGNLYLCKEDDCSSDSWSGVDINLPFPGAVLDEGGPSCLHSLRPIRMTKNKDV